MSKKPYENNEIPFNPSTIETIDSAIFDWLNEEMNLHTTTNEGWKKVPVIWVAAERAFQVKTDKRLRDNQGTFILPVITMERTGFDKDPSKRGVYWASQPKNKQFPGDIRGGTLEISKKINQAKTSKFANADARRRFSQPNFTGESNKTVYQTMSIPIPVYVESTYSIDIKTEYQQQMNDLIQPFVTFPGGNNNILVKKDGHKFEGFIQQSYSMDNNGSDLGEEERLFRTKIDIKVLGYLVGQGDNEDLPKVVITENQVEVKVTREKVMVGDLKNLDTKKLF